MTDRAEARRAVERVNTSLYAAIESGDMDLMEAVWVDGSDGADAVCVHPGMPPLRGRGEILRSWAAVMVGTPYIQFFLTDVEVGLLGDTAVLSCTENILTGVEQQGEGPLGFAGGTVVATNVFRRTTGGWRLLVHHGSPVLTSRPGGPHDEEEGTGG